MTREGQKQFGVSRFREWAAKLQVVKKQATQEAPSSGNSNTDFSQEEKRTDNPLPIPTRSVGSTLAAMLIFDNVREGNEVEIPSLGITLTKDDLGEEGSKNPSE